MEILGCRAVHNLLEHIKRAGSGEDLRVLFDELDLNIRYKPKKEKQGSKEERQYKKSYTRVEEKNKNRVTIAGEGIVTQLIKKINALAEVD